MKNLGPKRFANWDQNSSHRRQGDRLGQLSLGTSRRPVLESRKKLPFLRTDLFSRFRVNMWREREVIWIWLSCCSPAADAGNPGTYPGRRLLEILQRRRLDWNTAALATKESALAAEPRVSQYRARASTYWNTNASRLAPSLDTHTGTLTC